MQRSLRVRVLALAAVVAVLVAPACGSGSAGRVSRSEMIRRADALCAKGLRDADRLRADAQPGARGAAAAAEVDATLKVLDVQVDGIEDLRGPERTDAARERAVAQLRLAAELIERLRDRIVARDLTINEAIQASPALVQRINRASARATDALADLRFFTCIGVAVG